MQERRTVRLLQPSASPNAVSQSVLARLIAAVTQWCTEFAAHSVAASGFTDQALFKPRARCGESENSVRDPPNRVSSGQSEELR